jgi:putative PIN family toxin of toxin-antitoxin system
VKVVFDSNIYVSAYCFDRDPETVIDLGIAGKFNVYSSLYIIKEVRDVLVSDRLKMSTRFASLAAKRIERYSQVVPVRGGVRGPIPTDPGDGPIVKTCLACKADILVTRDKGLLHLPIRGMQSFNAGQFLRYLREHGIIAS